jgi:uncharacterized OsmC-like protein
MPTQATVQEQTVNGVSVNQFVDTVNTVRDEPRVARFNFRAHSRWMAGSHIRTAVQDFMHAGVEDTSRNLTFFMDAGEPQVLLGRDEGPTPFEALLHALASCLGISFIYYAAAREVKIGALELELEGEIDLQGFLGLSRKIRNGFDRIRVTFHVTSDAPRETLDELCNLAQRRSPVFDMVSNPVPVTVEMRTK